MCYAYPYSQYNTYIIETQHTNSLPNSKPHDVITLESCMRIGTPPCIPVYIVLSYASYTTPDTQWMLTVWFVLYMGAGRLVDWLTVLLAVMD